MRNFWKLLFGVSLLSLVGAHPALAQQVKLRDGTLLPEKPFFIVTYIEVAPAEVQKAADLLRKHSAASKRQARSLRFEALQGTGRKNHFDIIPPEQFPPCKRQVDDSGPCGNALVQKLVADSRKHAGNMRFDALTQSNRPNHMTIVEMWRSAKDHDAHIVHTDTKHFRDGLSGVAPGGGLAPDPLFVINPLSGSLYDEQLYALID